jgi:propanol-preferring alcohol dehydrogenase
MILDRPGLPLRMAVLAQPRVSAGMLLVEVEACGVCRTDLHIVDGDLPLPVLPIVPGHEIVGRVRAVGAGVTDFHPGQRVGIPWLGWTCGTCRYCLAGQENLCEAARCTGYQVNGGFAEYTVADARFCFPLPDNEDPALLAPLLCAGLIGYRALHLAGKSKRIALYGFGAAAHLIAQVLKFQQRECYALTRPGDLETQEFASRLGVNWAGGTDETFPGEFDAALIFAPAGTLVPMALRSLAKGGSVVCAGIHMSDIPGFAYSLLWGERVLRSVTNLTRSDGLEFLKLAAQIPVLPEVRRFPLEQANEALTALRSGDIQGAAVLEINTGGGYERRHSPSML